MYVKKEKCPFGQKQDKYLHLSAGVVVDPRKIESMMSWPKPQNLKALHGFLGLTGYYHNFIQNYGKIVGLLTRMLNKNLFQWDLPAEEAFERLKEAMTQHQYWHYWISQRNSLLNAMLPSSE